MVQGFQQWYLQQYKALTAIVHSTKERNLAFLSAALVVRGLPDHPCLNAGKTCKPETAGQQITVLLLVCS